MPAAGTACRGTGAGVLLTLPVLTIPALIIGPPPARQLQLGLLASLIVAVVIIGVGVTLLTLPPGAVLHRLRRGRHAQPRVAPGHRHRHRADPVPTAGTGRRSLPRSLVESRHRGGREPDARLRRTCRRARGGAHARPAEVLLAYVVAMALAIVPITPGGLGFVETGLTGALVLAGVDANSAVVATLLYRLMSFWLPIPVGALAWGTWTVHRR